MTSCSSSRRIASPISSPTSSACRGAGWCGCSRCPSRSGRGSRSSCTCPRPASPPSSPVASPTRWPRPTGPNRRRSSRSSGANTLARIAIDIRRPDDQTFADLDALEQAIDDVSTSWGDQVRAALHREVGEERARHLYEQVGVHAPASYRAATSADRAVDDLGHIAELLDGDGTDLGRVRAGRRLARQRLAGQGLPAGDTGHAGRAVAGARSPRPASARRAAVHVPHRRRPGLPLRHRRADARRRHPRRCPSGRDATGVLGAAGRRAGGRRVQPARPAGGAVDRRGRGGAGLRQVPPPDRVRLQPALRRGDAVLGTRN